MPDVGAFIFAEHPDRPATQARLLWRAECDPGVVGVRAAPTLMSDGNALDLASLSQDSFLIGGASGRQHLVISDGLHHLRLDVDGLIDTGPVRLDYQLSGIEGVEPQLHTVRRLLALLRLGRFARGLEAPPPRADRLCQMLRAYDLKMEGASQRAIAGDLFGHDRLETSWRATSDSLRLRVQRLCRDAARLVDGGYLALLHAGAD